MNDIGTYKEYQVRCYVCGELVASKIEKYERLLASGLSEEEAMDQISLRYCTRQAIMTPAVKYLKIVDELAVRGVVKPIPVDSMGKYSVQAGGEEYRELAESVKARLQIEKEVYLQRVASDMIATRTLNVSQIHVDVNKPFTSIGMPRSYMKWDEPIESRRLENGTFVRFVNHRQWTAQ